MFDSNLQHRNERSGEMRVKRWNTRFIRKEKSFRVKEIFLLSIQKNIYELAFKASAV